MNGRLRTVTKKNSRGDTYNDVVGEVEDSEGDVIVVSQCAEGGYIRINTRLEPEGEEGVASILPEDLGKLMRLLKKFQKLETKIAERRE